MNEFQQYAKKKCANFCGKDRCLMEPGGQLTCLLFLGDPEKARCKFYFEDSVLPDDPRLEAKYWRTRTGESEDETKMANCTRCGKEYKRRGNRAKYCDHCRIAVRNTTAKESMRKKRSQQQAE